MCYSTATTSPLCSFIMSDQNPGWSDMLSYQAGLHNMADHRTIGRRKFFRLAEEIEDKTVRG